METNINYTIVGIFVICLITVIVLGIIWLSSGFYFTHYTKYMVYMTESVSGIDVDSPVEYNGVNVGKVTRLWLNKDNPQIVQMILSLKSRTPITQGTVATINTRGFTGITYVALKNPTNNLTPLVALPGQKYPVIKSAPSLLTRLDTALTDFSKNFGKISDSIQSLLDKDNLLSIKNTLAHLQDVTGMLAENNKKFASIVENTSLASEHFLPLMQSTTSTARMLETQTLPATYRILSNLDNMMRSLAELSDELRHNPSILVRGVAPQPLGPGERVYRNSFVRTFSNLGPCS